MPAADDICDPHPLGYFSEPKASQHTPSPLLPVDNYGMTHSTNHVISPHQHRNNLETKNDLINSSRQTAATFQAPPSSDPDAFTLGSLHFNQNKSKVQTNINSRERECKSQIVYRNLFQNDLHSDINNINVLTQNDYNSFNSISTNDPASIKNSIDLSSDRTAGTAVFKVNITASDLSALQAHFPQRNY